MIVAILLLVSPALAVDGYQQAKWGMTVEQVRKVVPELGDCRSFSTSLAYCTPLELLNQRGEVSYQFDDVGTLTRVRLHFDRVSSDFARGVVKLLTEKYGEPSTSVGYGSTSARWVTHGVEMTTDTTEGVLSVRVTYDAKASSAGQAAKDAL